MHDEAIIFLKDSVIGICLRVGFSENYQGHMGKLKKSIVLLGNYQTMYSKRLVNTIPC